MGLGQAEWIWQLPGEGRGDKECVEGRDKEGLDQGDRHSSCMRHLPITTLIIPYLIPPIIIIPEITPYHIMIILHKAVLMLMPVRPACGTSPHCSSHPSVVVVICVVVGVVPVDH